MKKMELEKGSKQFFIAIIDMIAGLGAAKYATNGNLVASTEANFSLYGEDGILWAVSEKLYRYKQRKNKDDLVKAASWILLLWMLADGAGGEDGKQQQGRATKT